MINRIFSSVIRFYNKYKSVILLFVAVKLVFFLFIVSGKGFIPFGDNNPTAYHFNTANTEIENSLSAYDAEYYLEIASQGYQGSVSSQRNRVLYAFFPLFPLSIHLGTYITNNLYTSAILLNILFSFLCVLFLYKLFKLDERENSTMKGIFYFLVFPTAVFYTAAYSEALFFFLTLSSFYFARKRRWWLSGIIGFLAALCRSTGILLFLPLCIEYYLYMREHGIRSMRSLWTKTKGDFLSLLLIPFGLISFLLYSHLTTGNFLLPLSIQHLWERESVSLLNTMKVLYENIFHFFSLPLHSFSASQLDTLFILFFLAIWLYMLKKKMRASYLLYSFLIIFFPLLTGTTTSILRFISVSFPHFLILGSLGQKNKIIDIIITVSFILLTSILSLRFINWYWVA